MEGFRTDGESFVIYGKAPLQRATPSPPSAATLELWMKAEEWIASAVRALVQLK